MPDIVRRYIVTWETAAGRQDSKIFHGNTHSVEQKAYNYAAKMKGLGHTKVTVKGLRF